MRKTKKLNCFFFHPQNIKMKLRRMHSYRGSKQSKTTPPQSPVVTPIKLPAIIPTPTTSLPAQFTFMQNESPPTTKHKLVDDMDIAADLSKKRKVEEDLTMEIVPESSKNILSFLIFEI